jgi:putative transposase
MREVPPAPEGVVAGDLGVRESIHLSSGEVIRFPIPSYREERFYRFLCRTVSRRLKGSRRRAKAVERLSQFRRYQSNRLLDAQHKVSTRLAKNHGLLVFEDLGVRQMTQSARGTLEAPGNQVKQKAGLNRCILSQGWGRFLGMMEYKAIWNGGRLVRVNPAYSSQTCHRCGHVSAENRASTDRFRCVRCGYEANAHDNASLNILAAGHAATARGEDVRPEGSRAGRLDEARTSLALAH